MGSPRDHFLNRARLSASSESLVEQFPSSGIFGIGSPGGIGSKAVIVTEVVRFNSLALSLESPKGTKVAPTRKAAVNTSKPLKNLDIVGPAKR